MRRSNRLLLAGVFLALAIAPVFAQAGGSNADKLFAGFQDPPRKYTVRPFWFWNGKLDSGEVNRQIEEMVSQGVYGAYVHNRTGLQTPYLSEEYFKVIGSALKRSKELGFHFSFCDEYEWPSGEARDVWRKGIPSRVIAANPDFRMRALGYEERIVEGPKHIEIEGIKDFQFAVTGRMLGPDTIDEDTLTDISAHFKDGKLAYDVPAGKWSVEVYYLFAAQGFDGGLVDLMNRDAVRTFLDLTYEQYYKRFPEYFGSIIDSTFADHEGGYGYRLSWTPKLFETFLAAKGYDLHKYMPLLIHDGGKRTPKLRCDYLDTVSELYSKNFFGQVAQWCSLHGVTISGHAWEESLQDEATFDGDLQRIMRNWGAPGVDSLTDKGRSPREFKVVGSVAHFRGSRFICENQALEGWYSFLSPQKMRLGTNMIATWGVNQFVPHAFNYNQKRIEYPSDWFYHQPYWKYFKNYADYTRRLSFMNDGGAHVADVLIYQPTETAWANIDAVYSTKKWDGTFVAWPFFNWNNPVDTVNAYYTRLMEDLAKARWDYDVADAHYLKEARLEGRSLAIANEKFQVLILPPMTTIRRESARKIVAFYEAGGTVIATGFLPKDSMEDGRDDSEILAAMTSIFGDANPKSDLERSNAAGGYAYFVKDNLTKVAAILEKRVEQDVKVTSPLRDGFTYSHRRKEGADYYWLVNDSESAREFNLTLRTRGVPEKWDADGGSRQPLFYHSAATGTEVRLHFAPWEAYYVVFPESATATQDMRVEETNLETVQSLEAGNGTIRVRGSASLTGTAPLFAELRDAAGALYKGTFKAAHLAPLDLAGDWRFTPERKTISAPYAMLRRDYGEGGERAGWQTQQYPDLVWNRTWLSRERFTVRQWSLVGPFPNEDYKGFDEVYGPEQSFDPNGNYTGAKGVPIHWIDYEETANPYTELAKALGIPDGQLWATAYAHTYIYTPVARRVQVRTTADNNAKLWVNGKNLLDWLIVPWYYEMREEFALTRDAELQPGWNDLLLKVSRGQRGSFAFMVRVTDEQGGNIDDLLFSREKHDVAARAKADDPAYSTWYRIPVPATAISVRLPRAKGPRIVFYNGRKLDASATGIFEWGTPAQGSVNVLAVRLNGDESLADEPEFTLGSGLMHLGSWTYSGLPYYSGSAVYEREVDIPASYVGKRLVLDCGDVGVVAQVSINGQSAGVRVWLPFQFDIGKLVRTGKNSIRIVVTNAMDSERAVENHADKLDQIKLNGLLGPVRIMPYFDAEIECRRTSSQAASK